MEASLRKGPTAIKAIRWHHLQDTTVPATCLPPACQDSPQLTSALHTLLCDTRSPGQLTLTHQCPWKRESNDVRVARVPCPPTPEGITTDLFPCVKS